MYSVSSVYIHSPFCRSKCAYCDFFSVPVTSIQDAYVNGIINEFDYYKDKYSLKKIDNLYIGGGTPSLLSSIQLKKIISKFFPFFSDNAEITVEVNPESLTLQLLDEMLNMGITRISLGIQSMDDNCLSTVCRCCNSSINRNALRILSEKEINYSVDLIAGLPPQNDDEFIKGLNEVISYNPKHISLYGLTLEENTALYKQVSMGKIKCQEEKIESQWFAGWKFLEKHGFIQYEVSNFGIPGYESRHNINYWKQGSYLGLGAGGTGTLYQFDKNVAEGLRYTNSSNIDKYIDFWNGAKFFADKNIIPCDKEFLDQKILAFEFCMLGLRMSQGISLQEYSKRFSDTFPIEPFLRWEKKGLVEIKKTEKGDTLFAMTKKGLPFLNSFLSEL